MPCPFPGMDPFIENQEWEDFHATFNMVIKETLVPLIEPRYVARAERRVYVEHTNGDDDLARWADVAVVGGSKSSAIPLATPRPANATASGPIECVLPMPEEHREVYLVIRERATMEVVTVIETLSPANKRGGSDGRKQYLEKREEVLQSTTHLVKIDLLRGGLHMPLNPLPQRDYWVIVSRRRQRPKAKVYPWSIREPLPEIPVPLKEPDADVVLDLQRIFSLVYDRSRYELSLDYRQPLVPLLNDADTEWARSILESRRGNAK